MQESKRSQLEKALRLQTGFTLILPLRHKSAAFRLQQRERRRGRRDLPAPQPVRAFLQPKGRAPARSSGARAAWRQYLDTPLQTGQVGFEAVVPNPKLKLLNPLREVMRRKHYSIRTERTYADWVRRYVQFHRRARP